MINNKSVGRKLRELRISRGYKQYEVADMVGLSRPAVCNIEAGKRALTLNTLKKFCEVYSIDISYFGIETESFDDTTDLISRIEALFNNDELPEEKKDELYRIIMSLYLKSKN